MRWPERLDAHRLIEEFMILANVAAAETLEAAHSPLLYRAHDAPSAEKLDDLIEFLRTIGVKLAKGERVRPSHFNGVLAKVRGQAVEALVNEVVLRAQAQAEYAHENYGHFGLNLRRYAHFTSPIRRYADLIVHRALIRALNLGPGGLNDMRAGNWRRSPSTSPPPNGARWRPNGKPSTALSPHIWPTRWAPFSRAASRASPAPACS